MKLIENWRKVHKLWSVRISAAASIAWAALLASPETMLNVLNSIPADMRAWLPSFLPIALFALVTFARLVHQEKISGPK